MIKRRRNDCELITGGTLGISAINRILIAGLYRNELPEELWWMTEPDFRRNLHEVIDIITAELLEASEGPEI